MPFYQHKGRFDDTYKQQWKGIVPLLRNTINKAYGISVSKKNRNDRAVSSLGATSSRINTDSPKKPKIVWAGRTGNDTAACSKRCIVNEAELLDALRKKFEVDLLYIGSRKIGRHKSLVSALRQMATADVLGGLHGGGLGHTIFLQPGSFIFEMKDRSHWNTNLFLNMASLNHQGAGVSYYAYDTRSKALPLTAKRGSVERYYINQTDIWTIVEGLWDAWNAELKYRQQSEIIAQNETTTLCEFPRATLSVKVSSYKSSRCFLVQRQGIWSQVANPTICLTNQKNQASCQS